MRVSKESGQAKQKNGDNWRFPAPLERIIDCALLVLVLVLVVSRL